MTASRSLLVVDDDEVFARRLAKLLEGRGFAVRTLGDLADLETTLTGFSSQDAVVDLRRDGASGLDCVARLHAFDPNMRITGSTTGQGSSNGNW